MCSSSGRPMWRMRPSVTSKAPIFRAQRLLNQAPYLTKILQGRSRMSQYLSKAPQDWSLSRKLKLSTLNGPPLRCRNVVMHLHIAVLLLSTGSSTTHASFLTTAFSIVLMGGTFKLHHLCSGSKDGVFNSYLPVCCAIVVAILGEVAAEEVIAVASASLSAHCEQSFPVVSAVVVPDITGSNEDSFTSCSGCGNVSLTSNSGTHYFAPHAFCFAPSVDQSNTNGAFASPRVSSGGASLRARCEQVCLTSRIPDPAIDRNTSSPPSTS